ncbi:alpha/beta hydrolase [uncultured Cohaesibacter sp.]|uniref:alpha/beta fold hydrolase n=1 Tax=uncultured Cohaesibacter sp. TaxID=1002546 RepID=UPI0029C88AB0|nr:alpha/beta hydrolase [uncultured Cohaesibacter sp.]
MWHDNCYFAASDGVAIHYQDAGGPGVPILFVHGFTASIGGQWGRPGLIAGLRQKGWRTIAYDLRGHGKSERPHGYEAYANDRMGLDGIDLLDHLNIDKAHIVAYSLGAHIMVHTLQGHKDRALSLCLGGSAGRWDWTDKLTQAVHAEADELETGSIIKHILRQLPHHKPRPSDEELRQLSIKKLEGMDAVALAGIKRAMPDHAITKEQMISLAKAIATLGFVGTEDPQLPIFRDLAGFCKTLELVEIDRASPWQLPRQTRNAFSR